MFVMSLQSYMGWNFTALKISVEEAKTPFSALIKELSLSVAANNQQGMHRMPTIINNIRSRLPTVPTEEQHPIQNINSTFSNAVIQKKNNISLVLDSIL